MAKRSPRATLVRTAHGRRPGGHGWFILNARNAIWYGNGVFGAATIFENRQAPFPQVGINVHVLLPGEPNCHYHAESAQEDFLVLSGRCRVLIDGRDVLLKPWDLVHCPPWTDHVFVGAGKGPCVILMVGARPRPTKLRYPRSALAMKYRASSPRTTSDPAVSYAKVPRSVPVTAPPPFGRRRRMR
jgi:uncharacterized cupin superfamily protein